MNLKYVPPIVAYISSMVTALSPLCSPLCTAFAETTSEGNGEVSSVEGGNEQEFLTNEFSNEAQHRVRRNSAQTSTEDRVRSVYRDYLYNPRSVYELNNRVPSRKIDPILYGNINGKEDYKRVLIEEKNLISDRIVKITERKTKLNGIRGGDADSANSRYLQEQIDHLDSSKTIMSEHLSNINKHLGRVDNMSVTGSTEYNSMVKENIIDKGKGTLWKIWERRYPRLLADYARNGRGDPDPSSYLIKDGENDFNRLDYWLQKDSIATHFEALSSLSLLSYFDLQDLWGCARETKVNDFAEFCKYERNNFKSSKAHFNKVAEKLEEKLAVWNISWLDSSVRDNQQGEFRTLVYVYDILNKLRNDIYELNHRMINWAEDLSSSVRTSVRIFNTYSPPTPGNRGNVKNWEREVVRPFGGRDLSNTNTEDRKNLDALRKNPDQNMGDMLRKIESLQSEWKDMVRSMSDSAANELHRRYEQRETEEIGNSADTGKSLVV